MEISSAKTTQNTRTDMYIKKETLKMHRDEHDSSGSTAPNEGVLLSSAMPPAPPTFWGQQAKPGACSASRMDAPSSDDTGDLSNSKTADVQEDTNQSGNFDRARNKKNMSKPLGKMLKRELTREKTTHRDKSPKEGKDESHSKPTGNPSAGSCKPAKSNAADSSDIIGDILKPPSNQLSTFRKNSSILFAPQLREMSLPFEETSSEKPSTEKLVHADRMGYRTYRRKSAAGAMTLPFEETSSEKPSTDKLIVDRMGYQAYRRKSAAGATRQPSEGPCKTEKSYVVDSIEVQHDMLETPKNRRSKFRLSSPMPFLSTEYPSAKSRTRPQKYGRNSAACSQETNDTNGCQTPVSRRSWLSSPFPVISKKNWTRALSPRGGDDDSRDKCREQLTSATKEIEGSKVNDPQGPPERKRQSLRSLLKRMPSAPRLDDGLQQESYHSLPDICSDDDFSLDIFDDNENRPLDKRSREASSGSPESHESNEMQTCHKSAPDLRVQEHAPEVAAFVANYRNHLTPTKKIRHSHHERRGRKALIDVLVPAPLATDSSTDSEGLNLLKSGHTSLPDLRYIDNCQPESSESDRATDRISHNHESHSVQGGNRGRNVYRSSRSLRSFANEPSTNKTRKGSNFRSNLKKAASLSVLDESIDYSEPSSMYASHQEFSQTCNGHRDATSSHSTHDNVSLLSHPASNLQTSPSSIGYDTRTDGAPALSDKAIPSRSDEDQQDMEREDDEENIELSMMDSVEVTVFEDNDDTSDSSAAFKKKDRDVMDQAKLTLSESAVSALTLDSYDDISSCGDSNVSFFHGEEDDGMHVKPSYFRNESCRTVFVNDADGDSSKYVPPLTDTLRRWESEPELRFSKGFLQKPVRSSVNSAKWESQNSSTRVDDYLISPTTTAMSDPQNARWDSSPNQSTLRVRDFLMRPTRKKSGDKLRGLR